MEDMNMDAMDMSALDTDSVMDDAVAASESFGDKAYGVITEHPVAAIIGGVIVGAASTFGIVKIVEHHNAKKAEKKAAQSVEDASKTFTAFMDGFMDAFKKEA